MNKEYSQINNTQLIGHIQARKQSPINYRCSSVRPSRNEWWL